MGDSQWSNALWDYMEVSAIESLTLTSKTNWDLHAQIGEINQKGKLMKQHQWIIMSHFPL